MPHQFPGHQLGGSRKPVAPIPPGRRALLVGAGDIVGPAIAQALAADGFRVGIHHADRRNWATKALASLPGDGHRNFQADITDSESVTELFRELDAEFGGVDVVITFTSAHAAVSLLETSSDQWADSWAAALSADLLGAAMVTHTAARAFLTRGQGGHIILLASGPESGRPSPLHQAVSQGLAGLGGGLAVEMAPHGVSVAVVGGSGMSARNLAETVAWLAGGPVRELPGVVVAVNG